MNAALNLQSYVGKFDDAVKNVDFVKIGQNTGMYYIFIYLF